MTREQRYEHLKITEKIIIMWLYTTFPGSWQSPFLGLDKHITAWWRCRAVCLSVAHVVNGNSFCHHFSLLETVGKRKRNSGQVNSPLQWSQNLVGEARSVLQGESPKHNELKVSTNTHTKFCLKENTSIYLLVIHSTPKGLPLCPFKCLLCVY